MAAAARRAGRATQRARGLAPATYLLRYLNVTALEEALEIVTRYFEESQLPAKSRLALEELLSG